ncbi:hypothetical protein G6L37_06580 [Agrobacterium rubi]|nr:hypothetical protein [Agrobacterium rubi]NTF25029.1 hypothetical protein [Agrobacterium rubi]
MTDMLSNESRPFLQPSRSRFLEISLTLFVVAGTIHLLAGADNPHEEIVTSAVRNFSRSSLDLGCSAYGTLLEKGMPCSEIGGFRFVLEREGRYSLFALNVGSDPTRVSGSDAPKKWSGTREQLDALARVFSTAAPDYE